jgi:cell wall-associated NlpC family hydrolase
VRAVRVLALAIIMILTLVPAVHGQSYTVKPLYGASVKAPDPWTLGWKVTQTAKGLKGFTKYGKPYYPPYRMDCSGFTYYVLNKNGIKMPTRTPAKQANYGKTVLLNQLRPGDLVFFWTGSGKIGHVAIAIGNNQIIHSVGPGKDVQITNLKSSWYQKHYVTSKRLFE